MLKLSVLPEDIAEAVYFLRQRQVGQEHRQHPERRCRQCRRVHALIYHKNKDGDNMSTIIDSGRVAEHNASLRAGLEADYEALGGMLQRRGVDIEKLTATGTDLRGGLAELGRGHRRHPFRAFPGPRRAAQCVRKAGRLRVINQLTRATPGVSLHFPWDKTTDVGCASRPKPGLYFDAVNSNTFQDQPTRNTRYKYGSLTSQNAATRAQAVAHNIECIELGSALGSKALTVWVGDGANFPGQSNLRGALERYLDSMREIYAALPDDWNVFIEHKLFEPAFYATTIADWGTSFACAHRPGREGQVPGRPGPPCAEHQHRNDRRAPGAVRQAGRLPLQRQQVRRRRPGFGRSIRSSCSWSLTSWPTRRSAKAPRSSRPTCWTSRTT
jgi:hypothetical protein